MAKLASDHDQNAHCKAIMQNQQTIGLYQVHALCNLHDFSYTAIPQIRCLTKPIHSGSKIEPEWWTEEGKRTT